MKGNVNLKGDKMSSAISLAWKIDEKTSIFQGTISFILSLNHQKYYQKKDITELISHFMMKKKFWIFGREDNGAINN